MRIWLVYDRENIQRNQFFINRWLDAGRERGLSASVVAREELAWGVREGQLYLSAETQDGLPFCVVMRAAAPLLSAHFEGMGIPVFNNARLSNICNDKRLTHQFAAGRAPIMETAFINPGETQSPLPYPVVVKAARGNGGRQVYLAEDNASFLMALEKIAPDDALVQGLCDTPGRDVRIYMLGDAVVKSMMRFSKTDFRSNMGLGADTFPWDPGKETLALAQDFARRLDAGLIGVDFLLHRGQLVFNEIEDAVGTRMLYALGEGDIVRDYLAFILRKLDA